MNNPPERVSVIIPCYNAAAYIGEAINSVFEQQPPVYEVIVVDDGSTDASALAVAEFGEQVRYELQTNRGASTARNRGVELASGDFVAFLDADDVWTAGSLGQRLKTLRKDQGIDCVFGMVEQFISPDVDEETRASIYCPPEAQHGRLAGCMVIKREAYDRVGPFDEDLRLGETMDWIARAEASEISMVTLDEVVLRRRIHGSNTVLTDARLHSDYLRALRASIARRRAAELSGK